MKYLLFPVFLLTTLLQAQNTSTPLTVTAYLYSGTTPSRKAPARTDITKEGNRITFEVTNQPAELVIRQVLDAMPNLLQADEVRFSDELHNLPTVSGKLKVFQELSPQ